MRNFKLTILKSCFSVAVALSLLSACKKDTNKPIIPIPPTGSSPCRLTDEIKNFQSGYEHYWYTYTEEGKLDSIYFSQNPNGGYVAWCREDNAGFLWKTFQNTDGQQPNLYDNVYNTATQDSTNLPTTLQNSYQLFDGINHSAGGYEFQYKSNGLLDGYIQTWNGVTPPGLEYGMGVEYSTEGDVTDIVYNTITGPKTSTTVKAKGFDGHPTPWTGISGWVFLTPAVGWISSEYDPMFYALSAHNPTGSTFTSGTQVWKEDISYDYNDQGFPTKRTVVRTGPSGDSFTYYHLYTYDCN